MDTDIPGAAFRSGALLLSEGVNGHRHLPTNRRYVTQHWNGKLRSSEFQHSCALCRRVRRPKPHCTSSPLSFFLNDFPTAVDLAVSLRLSLVPEFFFFCRSKAATPGGGTDQHRKQTSHNAPAFSI